MVADLGGRWQLRTEPQVGAYVRRMLQVKPMRLTRAALEALAIIAYRQPITRPEMEDLRGVDCGAVTKALLERKLVRILGKKDEPGRPLPWSASTASKTGSLSNSCVKPPGQWPMPRVTCRKA